ncbi:MAG TPA: hypothetical protein PLH94_11270 [Fimbriimonadaceae bacterium]|nr:hypothetical protein [Fimbriimonadaceae bacterium]
MKAELSMAFDNLRGKAGTVVISGSRSGLIVKPRVQPRNPRTAAQEQVRANLTTASQLFKNFTPVQLANWKTYAASITKTNPVTGKTYNPTPLAAFVGLATKFLQANPNGTVPLTPPTADFNGDKISVTATGGSGKITFTASAPNSAGVVTELLLQPLKSRNRTPSTIGYRSKAFVVFASGSLSAIVNVPAGWYAAGYRVVNSATGQDTKLIPLTVNQVTFAVEEGGEGRTKKAA